MVGLKKPIKQANNYSFDSNRNDDLPFIQRCSETIDLIEDNDSLWK